MIHARRKHMQMRDSALVHLACASFGAGLAASLLFYVVMIA